MFGNFLHATFLLELILKFNKIFLVFIMKILFFLKKIINQIPYNESFEYAFHDLRMKKVVRVFTVRL